MSAKLPAVYIAGAYNSAPLKNIAIAVEAARRLREAGAVPIVPHLLGFAAMHTGDGNDYWLRWCLDTIEHAGVDFLYVFTTEDTVGTFEEIALAERLGLPVVYSLDEAVAMCERWGRTAEYGFPSMRSSGIMIGDVCERRHDGAAEGALG